VEYQDREERALLDAAERNTSSVDDDVKRAEQVKLHERLPRRWSQLTTPGAA
jgi:hypothetical protein